jgi:hypothetical protein
LLSPGTHFAVLTVVAGSGTHVSQITEADSGVGRGSRRLTPIRRTIPSVEPRTMMRASANPYSTRSSTCVCVRARIYEGIGRDLGIRTAGCQIDTSACAATNGQYQDCNGARTANSCRWHRQAIQLPALDKVALERRSHSNLPPLVQRLRHQTSDNSAPCRRIHHIAQPHGRNPS